MQTPMKKGEALELSDQYASVFVPILWAFALPYYRHHSELGSELSRLSIDLIIYQVGHSGGQVIKLTIKITPT